MGLLSNLARWFATALMQLQIIATNMHLSPEFGLTYREIEATAL
jgi:UDP-N-acetylglucosamine 2-epimerase (non-hydrolysing)/GDP/UDP-N,N'-diacetylbacillosamine 2-epimerase (hydrolysing)